MVKMHWAWPLEAQSFTLLLFTLVYFVGICAKCSSWASITWQPVSGALKNHVLSDKKPWLQRKDAILSDQIRAVAQSCLTLCDPMNLSTPGLPVHHQLPDWLTSIESVMPSSHLILCHPLLLLPPIPPSIRVFSNESALCMRWLKYWSFSFSIIPSKEIPGLIFRIDQLDLLAVQGTLIGKTNTIL